eukprot:gene9026-biopygen15216
MNSGRPTLGGTTSPVTPATPGRQGSQPNQVLERARRTQGEQATGAGVARAIGILAWCDAGVARAWRGHVLFPQSGGWLAPGETAPPQQPPKVVGKTSLLFIPWSGGQDSG